MADSDISAPSKKRAAGRELSRDNPGLDDEEETPDLESGTFKRASDEIIASRRIVKVRRSQPTSAPSSNPFAAIRLVAPTTPPAPTSEVTIVAQSVNEVVSAENTGQIDIDKVTVKITEEANGETGGINEAEKENETKDNQSEIKIGEPVAESAAEEENVNDKNNDTAENATKDVIAIEKQAVDGGETVNEDKSVANENKDLSAGTDAATPFSSFGQLSSSQNAFMGFAGTGFSTSTFSFGSVTQDGPAFVTSSGLKNDQPTFRSFSFGLSTNGSSSLFGSSSAVIKSETSTVPPMQEVPTETGEENEKAVFTAESVLFEFLDGGWKERGKGELKVNVTTSGTERARLIMRARGNYRLIMNASIYPDMKLANMEKKGITFACMNTAGEGKEALSTFALKFKDGSIVEEFRAAVTSYKSRAPTPSTGLKTPENSP